MTFIDGLFRNLQKSDINHNTKCTLNTKRILEMEEYDSDSLIDDIKNYSNLSKLLNDDETNFNLIKQHIYDYQCMLCVICCTLYLIAYSHSDINSESMLI